MKRLKLQHCEMIRSGRRSLSIEYKLAVILALILVFSPRFSIAESLHLTGLTEAAQDSELGLSITGRIATIAVKEGDQVKKGDLLLALDQDLERLEVARRKLVWKSRVELNSAKKQVETLEKHLRMTRELFETTGSVPREDLENKELELALAEAELERLEISERREKIEYDTALRQLAKRNLYAPFDGIVAKIMVGLGENCDIDTPLIRLVDHSSVTFIANVEAGIAEQLSLGQQVDVMIDNGFEEIMVKATVVFINPVIDPASRLRTVKAEFKNSDGRIVPGMSGTMVVENGKDADGRKKPE